MVVGSGIIASVRFCCTGLCCNVIDFTCRDGNSILNAVEYARAVWNGYLSIPAREGTGAPGHTVNLNSSIQSDYISKIYITDAFEGDTTYTSNGISVIKAVGTHINSTKNRVELTGGDSGTVTDKKNIDGSVSEGGVRRRPLVEAGLRSVAMLMSATWYL